MKGAEGSKDSLIITPRPSVYLSIVRISCVRRLAGCGLMFYMGPRRERDGNTAYRPSCVHVQATKTRPAVPATTVGRAAVLRENPIHRRLPNHSVGLTM